MKPNVNEKQAIGAKDLAQEQRNQAEPHCGEELKLRRWQVSFASGPEWYPVGEFVALDAKSAIERAIDIFGAGADYQAEEIPWDAAPLPQANRYPRRRVD